MELKINWPEGATHFCPAFGRYETRAYKKDGEVWHRWTGFDWHEQKFPPVTSVLRKLIARNEVSQVRWVDCYRPTIGESCQFGDDLRRWQDVTVLTYFTDPEGNTRVVSQAPNLGALCIGLIANYRPVPSAEQLVADAFNAKCERVAMAILGKAKDPSPGCDWSCNRSWSVSTVRRLVRAALEREECEQ